MKKFVTIAVLAGIGFVLWAFYGTNTPDFEEPRGVKLPPGSGFSTIGDSLEASGLIRNRLAFNLVGYTTGWFREMKPGYYEFESGASNQDLLTRIRDGEQTPFRVTLPPGSRPHVVAAVIERDLEIDSAAFRAAMRDPELLADLQTDSTRIFGYMLPETYFFFWGTTADEALRRLKEEFDLFFTEEMKQQAEALNLTVDEVINLAAIVEWEARLPEERPRIAGVYLNRLSRGMRLQADPTVQFALMQTDGGRMRRLFFRDYDYEHPYNTYLIDGLPPGPITNPSPSSIRAVLDPEEHDYLYFVAQGDGSHTFSRTLREHNRAAAAFRQLMRQRRRTRAES